MANEQEDTGFRVTDKRTFKEDGERRPSDATGEVRKEPETSQAAGTIPPPQEEPPGTGPKIDFPSYVLSYYTQGLVLLGEVPNPMNNKKEEDLEGARHTIDILAMLRDKTKGNLSREEDQLLASVLYELQLKFMAKTNRIKL
jgi:hypothetical protein